MPAVYRVFPFLATAAPEKPGGALYIPPQGGGRLDNPDLFAVLYLSNSPAGAIAEAFGRFPEWIPAILEGSPSLPASVQALARYRLPEDVPLCDLDDPDRLRSLGIRPSEVVSRDYGSTRAWARRIYQQHTWSGVRWWSYYDPRWTSIGLWETASLKLEGVRPLRLTDPDLVEAARTICRM